MLDRRLGSPPSAPLIKQSLMESISCIGILCNMFFLKKRPDSFCCWNHESNSNPCCPKHK